MNPTSSRTWTWSLLLWILVVTLPPLWVRTGLDMAMGDLLWAEDGKVFLKDAAPLGWLALIKPYEGYLHIYPRLVAGLNQFLNPALTPWVFTMAWVLAYVFLMITTVRVALQNQVSPFFAAVLAGALAIQPNNGEVFLTVTNAQWMMGTTLILQVLFEREPSGQPLAWRLLLLLLLGLTGPYAILLLPTIAVKCWLDAPFRQRVWEWGLIVLCGLIQLAVLASSDRVSKTGAIDTSPFHWALAFVSPFVLAPHTPLQALFALALLAMVFWQGRVKWLAGGTDRELVIRCLIALFFSMSFVAATLLAFKHAPLDVFHPHGKNRYTWVTTCVLFTAAYLLLRGRPVLNLLAVFLAMGIWGELMDRIDRKPLHFESLINLSRHLDTTIPINPKWAAYPGWHVATHTARDPVPLTEHIVTPELRARGQVAMNGHERWALDVAQASDLQSLSWTCAAKGDVAIELLGHESRHNPPDEGWIAVTRTESLPSQAPTSTMKRWPPVGDFRLAYGFEHAGAAAPFKLAAQLPPSAQLKQVRVYCLDRP
jgi:hypothetical protein